MRLYFRTIALLFLVPTVLATPVIDLTLSTAVARSPANAVGTSQAATTYYYAANGSHLAVIKATDNIDAQELAVLTSQANDQIAIKAFETAAKLTEVVCTNAGPTACVATALVAVIGIFFLAYKLSGRSELDQVFTLDYPPMAGVSTRYRLENEAPEGDWRLIGNATVNGIFHQIHYMRNGTINGLRSIQYGSVENFGKRAEDDDGGVVVDYNWNSLSETAYDSYDSTQSLINESSNDILTEMEDANGIQACANYVDSDGTLDAGLVSVGWNNEPFQFSDGQLEGELNECEAI